MRGHDCVWCRVATSSFGLADQSFHRIFHVSLSKHITCRASAGRKLQTVVGDSLIKTSGL